MITSRNITVILGKLHLLDLCDLVDSVSLRLVAARVRIVVVFICTVEVHVFCRCTSFFQLLENFRSFLEKDVDVRLIKVFEDYILAVVVDRVDGFDHCLHACDRDPLQIFQLHLKFLGLLQGNLILSILESLPIQSKGYFILIEIIHESKVLITHAVLH